MPCYKILTRDGSFRSAELTAQDAGGVLNVVTQMNCSEADVLEGDRYCFSVRLDKSGMWCIFQRHPSNTQPSSAVHLVAWKPGGSSTANG